MALLFLNRCPLKRGLPPKRLNKMKWRSIKTQPTSDEQYEVVFIIFQNTALEIMIMVGGKTLDLCNMTRTKKFWQHKKCTV